MKVSHDPDTDMALIKFEPHPAIEGFDLCEGVVAHVDGADRLVSLEVDHASERLDLGALRACAARPRREAAREADAPRRRVELVHDPGDDAALIVFEPRPGVERLDLCDGVSLGLDGGGRVVAIGIEGASRKFGIGEMRAVLAPERRPPR